VFVQDRLEGTIFETFLEKRATITLQTVLIQKFRHISVFCSPIQNRGAYVTNPVLALELPA